VLLPLLLVLAVSGVSGVASAQPRVIELHIRDGLLPKEQRLIRVRQNDEVTVHWNTNVPLVVHLHGYDIERSLAPTASTTMTFRARATGRFPITVHGEGRRHEATLGYLEVYPR
jgi:hypothetical protein